MESSDSLQTELFGLVIRRLEGTDDDADRRRLQEILAVDQAIRGYYIRQLHLMARLRWMLRDAAPMAHGNAEQGGRAASGTPLLPLVPVDSTGGQQSPPTGNPVARIFVPLIDGLGDLSRLAGVPRAIGIAVAGLLLAYFAVVLLSLVWTRPHSVDPAAASSESLETSSAILASAVDCHWRGGELKLIGGRLTKGEMCLESGLIQLNFDNGTQVVVEGPSIFQVKRAGELFLGEGRLVALVPRRAVGFTVETPLARIVDRGTEFGVDADPSGRVQVHVFRGSVDWQAHKLRELVAGETAKPAAPLQRLVAGESVMVDGAATAAPAKTQANAEIFSRALQLANRPSSLLRHIGDASAKLPVLDNLDLWLDANDVGGQGIAAGVPSPGSLIGTWTNKAPAKSEPRASDARQPQFSCQPVFRAATPRSVASVEFMGNQEDGQSMEITWPEPWEHSYSVFLTGVTRGNDLHNATDYFCDGVDLKNRVALPINPRGLSQVEVGAGLGELEAIVVPLERSRWQSWHLYSIVCDAGLCTFSIDGVACGRRELPAGVLKGLKLGSRYNGFHFLNGALGEVLVYRGAIADSDQALTERYLLTKWGLR